MENDEQPPTPIMEEQQEEHQEVELQFSPSPGPLIEAINIQLLAEGIDLDVGNLYGPEDINLDCNTPIDIDFSFSSDSPAPVRSDNSTPVPLPHSPSITVNPFTAYFCKDKNSSLFSNLTTTLQEHLFQSILDRNIHKLLEIIKSNRRTFSRKFYDWSDKTTGYGLLQAATQ